MNPSTRELVTLMVSSLPFGATGSVSAFLRICVSIWFLGVMGLGLGVDMFLCRLSVLSRHDCCKVTEWAAESLLELLGVAYAKEGKKATSFCAGFCSLGVVFNLSKICDKHVEIKHISSRREELLALISEMLDAGQCSLKDLERLRGQLLWFENFVCGRQANSAIAKLGDFLGSSKRAMRITDAKLERVSSGKPVVIAPVLKSIWLFFAGGACESQLSVGGALIHPYGKPVLFFGDLLPSDVEEVVRTDSKHPIYEVEILAILISIPLWGKLVAHAQSVFYLDNDAARSGFIRGVGATKIADVLIQCFCQCENALNIKSWFSRVPSHSNLGDAPSRSDDKTLVALGAKKCIILGKQFEVRSWPAVLIWGRCGAWASTQAQLLE